MKKRLKRHIIAPLQEFLEQERAGGIVLGISVIVAMLLANSPLSGDYFHLLESKFGFSLNGEPFLTYDMHHWINDGLMSLFFFLVGLELKREFIAGELSSFRKALLPLLTALGGMAVPAVVFHLFNPDMPESAGWGIPMATDIAFAVGVLYMVGDKVPPSFKIFLLALAIFDDLGAVIVIALFYTSSISWGFLLTGLCFALCMWMAKRFHVQNVVFYAIVGICGVWIPFLLSGVHATIGAVLAAFMIPANARQQATDYFGEIKDGMKQFGEMEQENKGLLTDDQLHIMTRIKNDIVASTPPLQRLEHGLHPFVTFIVLPIFALANAGLDFRLMDVSTWHGPGLITGVAAGLLVGKVVGIAGVLSMAVHLRIAPMPEGLHTRHLWGLGFLGSIGFTMSLFVTSLAYTDTALQEQAKIGIFAASIIGGVCAYLVLAKGKK